MPILVIPQANLVKNSKRHCWLAAFVAVAAVPIWTPQHAPTTVLFTTLSFWSWGSPVNSLVYAGREHAMHECINLHARLKGDLSCWWFSVSMIPCHYPKDFHLWGCPVYVLNPVLQSDHKVPHWQPPCTRQLGVFMMGQVEFLTLVVKFLWFKIAPPAASLTSTLSLFSH